VSRIVQVRSGAYFVKTVPLHASRRPGFTPALPTLGPPLAHPLRRVSGGRARRSLTHRQQLAKHLRDLPGDHLRTWRVRSTSYPDR
jgi:hypothetical protein